jgi:hypothetical protein
MIESIHRILLSTILLFLFNLWGYSQKDSSSNKIHYTTVSVSIGYIEWHIDAEQTLIILPGSSINLRLGYGFWSGWAGSGDNIYLSGKYLSGRKKSHLEADLGLKVIIDDCCNGSWLADRRNIYSVDYIPLINIGYRYEKPDGGLMFRIGAGLESFINLGLGYKFRY